MRGFVTVTAKELRSYVVSPIAWVVATVFLVVSGLLFYSIIVQYSMASLQMMQMQEGMGQFNINRLVFVPTFQNMAVILLLVVPIFTMRLLAEEKRNRTAQLLFTSPVRLSEIVAGKFMAATLLLAAILLLSFYMPLMAWAYGTLDWGPILTGYAGMILLAGAFAAFGLFASSLTENQIVAAVLTFGILLTFWAMGWAGQQGGSSLSTVLEELSIVKHLDGFLQGAVELKDVVYYLSIAAFGLFLTHRVLDSNRWR
ncbi:MAG: ABC transporter permease subunit [Deltaproteobacteria bacterium]|nr:ABC transporter permease subunit [Deltaproteobacteria bacterium]